MRRYDHRLHKYDYRLPGVYLVTLVTAGRSRSLARVIDGGLVLLEHGKIAERHLTLLPSWRPNVEVMDSAILPDHLHLIIAFTAPVPAGLGAVINCFKGGITREINRLEAVERVDRWQRGFWERVVRSEQELRGYRRYLAENPARWCAKYGSG